MIIRYSVSTGVFAGVCGDVGAAGAPGFAAATCVAGSGFFGSVRFGRSSKKTSFPP
jgi:hypothetical protein